MSEPLTLAVLTEQVARALSQPLANMQGGCFLPDGRSARSDCADGDCYCVRVSRHCARAALAAVAKAAGRADGLEACAQTLVVRATELPAGTPRRERFDGAALLRALAEAAR